MQPPDRKVAAVIINNILAESLKLSIAESNKTEGLISDKQMYSVRNSHERVSQRKSPSDDPMRNCND